MASGAIHQVEAEASVEIGDAEQHAAEDRQARLAEPVDQLLHRGGIDQAADGEGADEQADRR